MKSNKWITLFILSMFSMLLSGCGSNGQGMYFPNCAEMEENLKCAGYTVTVTEDFHEIYTGTYLCAEKGNDYIEFYWLDKVEAIDEITEEIKQRREDYNKLESRGNDVKYGTHVFCGTNKAIDASGITILKIKTDAIKLDEIKVDIHVDVN